MKKHDILIVGDWVKIIDDTCCLKDGDIYRICDIVGGMVHLDTSKDKPSPNLEGDWPVYFTDVWLHRRPLFNLLFGNMRARLFIGEKEYIGLVLKQSLTKNTRNQ